MDSSPIPNASRDSCSGGDGFFARLDRINRAISSSVDPDAMLEAVVAESLDIFCCDRAFILFPCDPEAPEWSVPIERTTPDFPGVKDSGGKAPMNPGLAAMMGAALAASGPVAFHFDPESPQAQFDKVISVRSRLVCAVRPRLGKPWLFGLHHCRAHHEWNDSERMLLTQLAQRVTDALSMRLMLRELKTREEALSSIVSSMADWVWECDALGRFTYASEKVVEILGYAPEEVVGRTSYEFMKPDEARRCRKVLVGLASLKLPIRDLINWNVTRDGREICLVTNGAPIIDGAGNLVGYRGVDKDVTREMATRSALVESEGRFRDLFARAAIGIILSDAEQRVVDANPEALNILGYTRSELLGLSGFDILHPEDQEARPIVSSSEFAPDQVIRLERRYRARDGRYVPVLSSISRNRRGEFMIMFQDLTDVKRMELQLLQAQKMEAVGTLSSGIAHDFNNILQSILGFSELMSDDEHLPGNVRANLARIESSVSRGAALVKNLLSFARSDKPSFCPLDLNREVRLAADILGRTLPKMILIDLDLEEELPPVAADPAQFEQILINLATNARDAMGPGGTLTFSTSRFTLAAESPLWPHAKPGPYVRISVSDTGSGIDRETLGRIFEPFFTTKEVGRGTGLGLSSVYGIVRNHGGSVRCESEPGEGTTFTILLPVAVSEVREEESGARRRSAHHLQEGCKPRILVVDDEDDVRDVAVFGLSQFGFATIAATSGEEALARLGADEEEFDAVLLDLSMPGMGGERTLELIGALYPGLPVVVASGYAPQEASWRLRELGARDYVRKPYRLKILAEALTGALKRVTDRSL